LDLVPRDAAGAVARDVESGTGAPCPGDKNQGRRKYRFHGPERGERRAAQPGSAAAFARVTILSQDRHLVARELEIPQLCSWGGSLLALSSFPCSSYSFICLF